MRRRSKLILGAIAAALLVAILVFVSMIRNGFSAHDQPSRLEAAMAGAMRR